MQNFLLNLEIYPSLNQINEASNYAQEKATEYLLSVDQYATLTVDEGETYIISDIADEHIQLDVQTIFDENFSSKIHEIQNKL